LQETGGAQPVSSDGVMWGTSGSNPAGQFGGGGAGQFNIAVPGGSGGMLIEWFYLS
jgi:hypothetical protein